MRTIILLSSLALTGCSSLAIAPADLNATKRLMAHPQYKAAMKAAPDFTRDALIAVENLRFTLEQQ